MADLQLRFKPYARMSYDETRSSRIQLIEVIGRQKPKRMTITESLLDSLLDERFSKNQRTRELEGSLRIFTSIRQEKYNGDLVPLPISMAVYEKLALLARIPTVFLETLRRSIAMEIYATPELPPVASPAWTTLRKESISFIICSVPNTNLYFGASFTYHFPTRHMDIFVHYQDSSRRTECLDAIERNISEMKTPFLIPSLLIRINIDTRLRGLEATHEQTYELERTLNIRYDEHTVVEFTNTDFETMTKSMNSLNTNLAYQNWAVKSTKRQLGFLGDVAERYYRMAVDNGIDEMEAENVKCQILENLAYLRSWNQSIEERVEYLQKRTQALVQTVYSGIAQRDAALSQSAAVAAARDSSVMRVIAAITIIFLPATTSATFFSTGFFDFKVGPHDKIYSQWLWLYWVVTIGLTAIVLLGAVFWWRKKEREIMARIAKTNVRKE